ncbi:hypothetical protein PENTCL1PPCAC_8748 [Pristionchus entomophagus]|uniref:DNA2/NAM7 helicase-like C-terminal domain-containing protein n=1 Tax=Pristionchus entomophagus TaxID=358040 RepID=A0AAV5SX47_9BILA|nr:hypothetical protein PENTCL1PPCAC_8748 [Pristionchus entomophagus]
MGLLDYIASFFSSEEKKPKIVRPTETYSYSAPTYNRSTNTFTAKPPPSTANAYPGAYSRPTPAVVPARRQTLEETFARLSVDDTPRRFHSIDDDDTDSGIVPVYTLSVTDQRVVVFEPAREKFIESSRTHLGLRNIEKDGVYHCSGIAQDRLGSLSTPSALTRKQYLERGSFTFGSAATYRDIILPALLLGSRVRDFEQRCATVDQIGTVVLIIPVQNRRLKTLKLKTTEGNTFEIDVKFVKKGKEEDLDKKWTVICHPPKAPLPLEVVKNAHLEMMDTNPPQPRVTAALMRTYANKKAPIFNWELLSAIYGTSARRVFPAPPYVNPQIRLAKLAGTVGLNPEQAEAVARYNCNAVPAFVVESPPGSGKTMTAAAMAVSYTGSGVQLFLSTANVPVINMALALSKLDYSGLKPLHFISSEKEELMTDETRSPFSILSLAKEREGLNEKIHVLEEQLKHAPNFEEKDKLKAAIQRVCGPVYNDDYNVFFATVDMILGRLFKGKPDGKPDSIKKKIMNDVRRIVVDEASQLTESALNALILCFPQAQIVLIGDSKQLPPFRYVAGDVVSELAARSALEVVKDKMNLPVIKLTRVYRASPRLAAHYSDAFYGGGLQSCKAEVSKNVLDCFGARSKGCRLLFWKVKGWQKQSGTSKVNDSELVSLKYLVNMLRLNGYDEKSVMIISYYEAQRKRAEEQLEEKYGEGYEVLTVDSAQGREKKIVIVLTTRTSVPTDKGAFFSCPLRCNVAVSRHQEALIVLGHQSIASAPNWARVLSPKYFRPVEDQKK